MSQSRWVLNRESGKLQRFKRNAQRYNELMNLFTLTEEGKLAGVLPVAEEQEQQESDSHERPEQRVIWLPRFPSP